MICYFILLSAKILNHRLLYENVVIYLGFFLSYNAVVSWTRTNLGSFLASVALANDI